MTGFASYLYWNIHNSFHIKCHIKIILIFIQCCMKLCLHFSYILNLYLIISQIFQEARRNLPSIIYVPAIAQWWNLVPETLHAVFLSHLCKLDPSAPILLIATADIPYNNLPQEVSWNILCLSHFHNFYLSLLVYVKCFIVCILTLSVFLGFFSMCCYLTSFNRI